MNSSPKEGHEEDSMRLETNCSHKTTTNAGDNSFHCKENIYLRSSKYKMSEKKIEQNTKHNDN